MTFEWNMAPITARMGSADGFELEWRRIAYPEQPWQRAKSMLKGTQCVKKNLESETVSDGNNSAAAQLSGS